MLSIVPRGRLRDDGVVLLGLVLVCLAVAIVSLLVLKEPSYDPTAWLIWGRQIVHGSLDTVGGPSWKPLTVLFTTVFSLAGSGPAPLLWLVVARLAGLLALVVTYRVTRRLGGRAAALVATAALAVSTKFLYNATRGDSEGLLVLLVLGAILAQLDGRRRLSFALMAAAALLRPEAWLLVAAQGVWLLRAIPRRATLALVVGSGLAVIALWAVPELIGSGDALRSATRALKPVAGSPGQSSFPFLHTFVVASAILPWPVYVGAVFRVGSALTRRPLASEDRAVLVIAAGASVFMVTVAVSAELGFTGTMRYATLPAAGLCVLGGLGLAQLVALGRGPVRRAAFVVVAVLVVGTFGLGVRTGVADMRYLGHEEQVYGTELPALIARAGGAGAIRRCAPLESTPLARQAVAWRLHVTQAAVTTTRELTSGTLLGRRGRIAHRSTLPLRAQTASLALRSTCRLIR
jgi:hypothetical protein